MKPILVTLLSGFFLSSCLVIKIYESPDAAVTPGVKPHQTEHQMIFSGKQIDLGEKGVHGLLFFGKEAPHPKGFLFKEAPPAERDEISTDSAKIWIQKRPQKEIHIFQSADEHPLIIIDGKQNESKTGLAEIDPEGIEAVNILKGPAAIEKYGEKGKNGVIEITTKSNP
jgi:TonB-dependent SusC/RagA subfamily outer membrane receptor